MTWISYKRGGEFYAKERGKPLTEIRIDYGLHCDIQATGEISGKTAKKLAGEQALEVKEHTHGTKKRMDTTAGNRDKARHTSSQNGNLQQPADESQDEPDEA